MALSINIDVNNLDLASQVGATSKQIKDAYNRAVMRTINFISTRVARELSQALDVPQRTLKFRMMKRIDRANNFGYLWIGLNPVDTAYLGKARQTKIGVSVRKHRLEGAFIATMPNGKIGVYKRKTEKPLPLEKVRLNILETAGIEEIITRYQRQAERYFEKQFTHELNYIKSKSK